MSSLSRSAAQLLVPLHQTLEDIDDLLPMVHRAQDPIRREIGGLVYRITNVFPYLLAIAAEQERSAQAREFAEDLSHVASQLRLYRERADTEALFTASVYALELTIASGAWLGLWMSARGGPEHRARGARLAEGYYRLTRRLEYLGRKEYPLAGLLRLLQDTAELSIETLQVAVLPRPRREAG